MKINTKDIYFNIDSKIVEKGFWSCDLNGQKKLIEIEMINFTKKKMKEYSLSKKNIANDNLIDLFLNINDQLSTKEQKEEFFNNYTHYILKVAGALQGCCIIWWQEADEELKEKPYIEFDQDDKWDSLKTHAETSPVNVTLFVLDIFNNHFGLTKENKVLIKQK